MATRTKKKNTCHFTAAALFFMHMGWPQSLAVVKNNTNLKNNIKRLLIGHDTSVTI